MTTGETLEIQGYLPLFHQLKLVTDIWDVVFCCRTLPEQQRYISLHTWLRRSNDLESSESKS